jgi:hypothetical protein
MKALTVVQPWAWAIIHGLKRIENRSKLTNYRGPLLIHAGKSRSRLGHYGPGEPDHLHLDFGTIIGVVELVDCIPVAQVRDQPFAEGPWCWILENPRPLAQPIPWRGALSFFHVPDHLIP